jgi:hypothetical protein
MLAMADNNSGGMGVIGVVVGALLVIVVVFFMFGGWGWVAGDRDQVDVTVETPDAPATPAPAEEPAAQN